MAPQKYTGQVVSAASGGRASGAVCVSALNAVKKPKMEQIQADHELFLQAFESESESLKHEKNNYMV